MRPARQTPLARRGARLPSAVTALGIQTPPERVRAAAVEHERLLATIARRRTALAQLQQEARAAVTQVARRMGTIVEEAMRLDGEIHAMLDALASDPARSRAEREELRRLHRDLQGQVISIRPDGGAQHATSAGPAGARHAAPPGHPGARIEDEHATVPSKPRPADRGVLRGLFRKLVEALHPDKVQDDAAKASRTEIMKQVTVAYQDGDLARLVEIERAWATSEAPPPDAADEAVDRHVAARERTNAELRTQLRALDRELRALRASAEGKLAKEVKRHGDGELAAEADQELRSMRQVRDFVRAFRDGQISLEELLDGPSTDDVEAVDATLDDDEVMAALVMLAHEVGLDLGAKRPGRGRGVNRRTASSGRR